MSASIASAVASSIKHEPDVATVKDGVRQCDVCEKPCAGRVCDGCTQEAVRTLEKLAKHFNVPVPDFCWRSFANRHGRVTGNRIELSTTSYVPVKDNLAHEFAHHLTDTKEAKANIKLYQAAVRERKLSQFACRPPRSWKPHGRQFFDSLSAVVTYLYENPDKYSWDEEIDQVIRWWKSQRADSRTSSAHARRCYA